MWGCLGTTPEAQAGLNRVQDKYPALMLTVRGAPALPARILAQEGEVTVEHYFRGGDHGPAHAHVNGGGQTTRIGPKGHPLRGNPPLSAAQQKVVRNNANDIRKAINKIGRWLKSQEQ
jgi:hypothetical protein